ncbi:MAG TPA: 6-phosphogluconolactonase [Myxococcales bacterium]|jgi:glucosamine-6-phosphate deaminase|nr:6-phosphogluconolactonase [Myxococcales bacterium]
MSFRILVTRDFDQMSKVAADLVEADIREKHAVKDEYVLGLATGNTPTGLYKHLAKAFNAGRIDPRRIRSFNLDEYVGLPGENPQQRTLHPESYSSFMVSELFALLGQKFRETNVPAGTLIDQTELIRALERHPDSYELRGSDKGKAVVIKELADGVLRQIKEGVLDAYAKKIASFGGIDLHIVGVGARGHVAFHESGIPFETSPMLLVRLDDDTVQNAIADGHFTSVDESPRYAISMGAGLVFQARTVVLLANGTRKTLPVCESVLGPVRPDVPISYGQRFVESGGTLVYVLDEAAAAALLSRRSEVEARGCELIDLRGQPYERVADLAFTRDPSTGRMR